MELQAVAAHLYVVNGEVQDGQLAPGLKSLISPGRTARPRRRDSLFLHLTLSGNAVETRALSDDIADSVRSIFYETSGSVTAALRRAIIDTNQLLLRYNLSGKSIPREGAITCAALRGEELFTAQVGEALAMIGHNFGIERLPSSALDVVTPLGRSTGLDIHFYHHRLAPGNSLLLADPLMGYLDSSDLEPALTESSIDEGIEQIRELIGQGTARVILIEFADESPPEQLDAVYSSASPRRRSLPPPVDAPLRTNTPSAVQGFEVVPDTASKYDVDFLETRARLATSRAAGSLSEAAGGLANLLTAVRSPVKKEKSDSDWQFPTVFAVIIPLIIGLIVAGVYIQRGQVLYIGQLKSDIDDYLQLAEQAGDDKQAVAYYYGEALRLLDESQGLRPGDDELLQTRLQVQSVLDSIVGVSRLGAHVLFSFDEETKLGAISSGDSQTGELYVIDETANRVYKITTTDDIAEAEMILYKDQAVGSHIVGPLIDLVWRSKGTSLSRDGIAVLDERGSLISYYPNFADTRAVDLDLSTDWLQPLNLGTFNERLYILDRGAKGIWRYFPQGDGFTIEEDQEFVEFDENPELDKVIDFSIISEDGSVVLLYEDGRLRRYANGFPLWDESSLLENGLESPMVSPTALKIAGSGLNSSIFVSDPGSGRILQFSLGGTYLAQYRALDEGGQELYSTIADFVVLDNPLRIFSLDNNQIYLATLE